MTYDELDDMTRNIIDAASVALRKDPEWIHRHLDMTYSVGKLVVGKKQIAAVLGVSSRTVGRYLVSDDPKCESFKKIVTQNKSGSWVAFDGDLYRWLK